MGFFSARRPEQAEQQLDSENAGVRVIRSRFYGKNKGKAPEVQPEKQPWSSPPSLSRATASKTASPSRTSTDVITITLAQRLDELAVANSEGLLNDDEYRLLRQNLFERFASGSSVPTEKPLIHMASREVIDGRASTSSPIHGRRPSSQFHLQSPRPSSVMSKSSLGSTVTGLLKRATSKRVASAPSETGKSDTISVISFGSTSSPRTRFPRILTKRNSDASIRTQASEQHSTLLNKSEPIITNRTLGRKDSVKVPSTPRSIRRGATAPPSSFPGASTLSEGAHLHQGATDPSDDSRLQTSREIRQEIESVEAEGRRLLDAFNGLELTTLVRQQRRPSNSPLSVATLLPSHVDLDRHRSPSSSGTAELKSQRSLKDIDAMSVRSSGSRRTAASTKLSPASVRARHPTASHAPVSQPVTLGRKSSISSVSSYMKSVASINLPTAPPSPSRFGFGSTSSVNLARSTGHLPLATVSETDRPPLPPFLPRRRRKALHETLSEDTARSVSDISEGSGSTRPVREDDEMAALETEMADIRRRRTEVTARYEARLEFLRAKLKGAELRERLMKS